MLWFKHPDGRLPNLALFTYLLLGYPAALYGLASPAWFVPSLLLLTHTLVAAAYLLHECLHNNIFAAQAANDRLGTVLAWLVGAVYSPYPQLREKHYRHHIERADILAVNYQRVLANHPRLDRCVQWAARVHLPAVDLLLQGLDVLAPFYLPQRRHLRARALRLLAVRCGLLFGLCWFSPLAAAGYLIAYLLMLWVLGFMDAFQHTYDIHYRLTEPQRKPARDRAYEESHTFTNLLSLRYPLVNLLVLNFCYHNVHHQKPSEPWHRLPALHRARYPGDCNQFIPLATQFAQFHRYRVDRILRPDSERMTGVDGVSFLVGV